MPTQHPYQDAEKGLRPFWSDSAQNLDWIEEPETILTGSFPEPRWFEGGSLNASVNCLDRHITAGRGNKIAIYWEGEDGSSLSYTYAQLLQEVTRCALGLKSLGVQKGDRVVIFLGMIPALPISMLACARIGAIHSVVFAGLGSESLAGRIQDLEASYVITADASYRRGSKIPLKSLLNTALVTCPSVKKVVVVKYTHLAIDTTWDIQRDVWWHELIDSQQGTCVPQVMQANDLLFVLYTSGTTGKPKGIMHSTAGYMVGAVNSFRWVFEYKENDIFWGTADCGWITGHTYVVYGPLSNGATILMYEGSPDYPNLDRWWDLCEKYKVTIFYSTPTVLRMFMREHYIPCQSHNLSSLRLLGSNGEPINPSVWKWYFENVGNSQCKIVDTWWQTETGMILIAPLPNVTQAEPGSATIPLPTIQARILNAETGEIEKPGTKGLLSIVQPWPSQMLGIWRNRELYLKTYFPHSTTYYAGDVAYQDEKGYFWIAGRADDVIIVSGHNISSVEIESALITHPAAAEAAVIGMPSDVKGEAIMAFVIVKEGIIPSDDLRKEISQHVAKKLGPIMRPEKIVFTPVLPKTRSGKIMRKLLRNLVGGKDIGDTTTLTEPGIIEQLRLALEQ